MLQVVKGVYENGQIILEEKPEVKPHTKVLVTFLEDETENKNKTRIPGGLKGLVSIPDNFNEPLDDLNEYM